jgi:hypothetical protein
VTVCVPGGTLSEITAEPEPMVWPNWTSQDWPGAKVPMQPLVRIPSKSGAGGASTAVIFRGAVPVLVIVSSGQWCEPPGQSPQTIAVPIPGLPCGCEPYPPPAGRAG